MSSLIYLLNKYWKDVFPDNVIYLSVYKYERNKNYPNVGFRFFNDCFHHKHWLQEETKRITRMNHNKGVLERAKLPLEKK